jgi:hypothetical protein
MGDQERAGDDMTPVNLIAATMSALRAANEPDQGAASIPSDAATPTELTGTQRLWRDFWCFGAATVRALGQTFFLVVAALVLVWTTCHPR